MSFLVCMSLFEPQAGSLFLAILVISPFDLFSLRDTASKSPLMGVMLLILGCSYSVESTIVHRVYHIHAILQIFVAGGDAADSGV